MNQSRQLAAIIFTDIVGYTALMQQDEKKAFDVLKKNLAIHQSVINEFHGRLIKELGDGILASFSNVSDAVNAAIKLQKQCNETNEFKLSIGIHQGEVVFENGDIFGDAVNVASRIQSLGISGSILISKKITDEIKNKSEFTTSSLGSFEFKNVNEPIEVFALTNQGLTVPRKSQLQGKLKKIKQKRNLIAAASVIFLLITISLAYYIFFSSERVVKKNITTNPIAYDWYMKAQYRFSPENKDDLDSSIFFLKNAIEADSTFALAHSNLSQMYLYMHYFIDPRGGYNEKAFLEAEKSLYLDPNLAEGFFARANCTWTFQNKFPHEKVIREFKRAIALKPNLDEAYHYLGIVYFHLGLLEESITAINKAMLLNPVNNISVADYASAHCFSTKNTDLELAIELFKKVPEHLITSFRAHQWAMSLISLERYEEAESMLLNRLVKDSSDLFLNSAYAVLLIKKGDYKAAQKRVDLCENKNLNTGHFHHVAYALAISYALLGDYQNSVAKLTWAAENGFPDYPLFSNDPLLASLHQYPPYQQLMEKLKTSWVKFKEVAAE